MSGIPNSRAANALSVADGVETVGFLVESGGAFFSFDRDGVLIGEYATQRQAMRSIPAPQGATPNSCGSVGITGGTAAQTVQTVRVRIMRKVTKEEMLDGFDVDADEQDIGPRRVVQGGKVKFTNDFTWVDSNEEEIPATLELIIADRTRVLQKWSVDGAPLETTFLEHDEKWPDVKALNNATPRSEWREGFGNPVGPWQCSWVAYLLNPLTADKYTYVTNTVGGHMAVGEIADKIRVMRRFRGAQVYPLVCLSDTFMPTRYGGRQRPSFKVLRWVSMDGDAALPAPEEVKQLPAQEEPASPAAPATATEAATPEPPKTTTKRTAPKQRAAAAGMKVVEEPSIEELLDDEINY